MEAPTGEPSRKRRLPHIEGNFSTIVAIRITNRRVLSELVKLQASYQPLLPSTVEPFNFDPSECWRHNRRAQTVHGETLGPHISLSLNQYLKAHQIEHFVKHIAHATLAVVDPLVIRVIPAPLYRVVSVPMAATIGQHHDRDLEQQSSLPSLRPKRSRTAAAQSECQDDEYRNDDTVFAMIEVDRRSIATTLGPLIDAIDLVIQGFGGRTIPRPFRPHISLFHGSGDSQKEGCEIPEELDDSNITNTYPDICYTVKAITLRIGKCHIDLPLRPHLRQQHLQRSITACTLDRILAAQTNSGKGPAIQNSDKEGEDDEDNEDDEENEENKDDEDNEDDEDDVCL